MSSRISKRKQPEREVKPLKERLKIFDKVLDDLVLDILLHLINVKAIDSLDYPISSGKEAVVFRASKAHGERKEYLAVKVFKYETSSFKHMQQYIQGDRNFDPRKNKRLLVNDWARKEYANLQICTAAGIRVPKPLFHKKNVIMMEFLGEGGVPSALMEEVVLSDPQETFDEVQGMMRKIYEAGLVHADLSSFNVIIHKGRPVVIDWAQGVSVKNPVSREFLRKDCANVAAFFADLGVPCTKESVYKFVCQKDYGD